MNRLTDVVPAGRDATQHPEAHRYHLRTTQAGVTEVEVSRLVAALAIIERPTHLLETGTSYGDTTRAISEHLDGEQVLWTIERDAARIKQAKRGIPNATRVRFVHGSAHEWKPPKGVRFGFAFFDATMKRGTEYRHFHPHIMRGALVMFHDTATNHGTSQQLQALITEGLLTPGLWLDTPRGVWVGRCQHP